MDGQQNGRLDNKEPFRFYTRDDENTLNLHPLDYSPHKAFSGIKIANLQNSLQIEQYEKYISKVHTSFKAEIELQSVPECFNKCISDISSTALNSVEKNCVRDCYFKKVTSRDDIAILMGQMMSVDYGKSLRERLV